MQCRWPQLRSISSHQAQLTSSAPAGDADRQQPISSSHSEAQVLADIVPQRPAGQVCCADELPIANEPMSAPTCRIYWLKAVPVSHDSSSESLGTSPCGSAQDADFELVETRLPLPAVEFRPTVLSVAAAYPPRTTAGAPFTLRLRMRNDSPLSQAVHVTVGSADGFLFSGHYRRCRMVSLPIHCLAVTSCIGSAAVAHNDH